MFQYLIILVPHHMEPKGFQLFLPVYISLYGFFKGMRIPSTSIISLKGMHIKSAMYFPIGRCLLNPWPSDLPLSTYFHKQASALVMFFLRNLAFSFKVGL